MIHLFTDFGLEGPYIGQVKAVLHRSCPGVPVIDLCADAPAFDPRAAAYLLAAYDSGCEAGDVVVAVVDPGVGGARATIVLEVDGRWYVGPDNGIFEAVLAQAAGPCRCWEIIWRPAAVSPSFHGRDIFAPIAAAIAGGKTPDKAPDGWFRAAKVTRKDWPADLAEVVYVDHFGNLVTGLRAASLQSDSGLSVNGRPVSRAKTFSDVSPSGCFCYENANGLMEIAVNQERADQHFSLDIGAKIEISMADCGF
jgi:S-adenosylmethionine hydrolase